MKRILVACLALLVLFALSISLASAQATSAVASIPRASDSCGPTVTTCPTSTPAPNSGGQTGHSGDEDGDGIPDGIDQCPNEGGPSSNQGCPAGRNYVAVGTLAPVVLATPFLPGLLLPILPTTGNCVLATRTGTPVNVRNQPSTSSAILGTLDPKVPYLIISVLHNSEGIWYKVIPGWVAQRVVRIGGGNCNMLPVIEVPGATNSKSITLLHPPGFGLTLDKGNTPGTDGAQGYCSSGFGVNFSKSDGSDNGIHFVFGDGSVRPAAEQLCIKLNADGQGFVITPPDPNKAHFAIDWEFGIDPATNALTFFAILPPNPAKSDPPDPDKISLLLAWSFLPPPCDQDCQSRPQNLTIHFDGSLSDPPDPDKPGLLLSWNFLPSDSCKQGDQSCPAQGAANQGVLINFLPAVQNSPLTDTHFVIDWFPNGFDPSVGGFAQVKNQPNGSSPGDKYGFTQIENPPSQDGVAIHFSLPAVQ